MVVSELKILAQKRAQITLQIQIYLDFLGPHQQAFCAYLGTMELRGSIGVRCQVSVAKYQVSGVACHMSPVTCH